LSRKLFESKPTKPVGTRPEKKVESSFASAAVRRISTVRAPHAHESGNDGPDPEQEMRKSREI
jgi:hypothetical protein